MRNRLKNETSPYLLDSCSPPKITAAVSNVIKRDMLILDAPLNAVVTLLGEPTAEFTIKRAKPPFACALATTVDRR